MHPTPECLDLALRRKAFGRALHVKAQLELAGVSAYIEAHAQSVVTTDGSTPELPVQQVPNAKAGLTLMSTR